MADPIIPGLQYFSAALKNREIMRIMPDGTIWRPEGVSLDEALQHLEEIEDLTGLEKFAARVMLKQHAKIQTLEAALSTGQVDA